MNNKILSEESIVEDYENLVFDNDQLKEFAPDFKAD